VANPAIGQARGFLVRAPVLLLEPEQFGESILNRILTINGAKTLHRFDNVEAAKALAAKRPVGLVVINASNPRLGGYDFVKWFRAEALEASRGAPVLICAETVAKADALAFKESGGNILLKLPVSETVLLKRIAAVIEPG
jgi:DNA-binding response OmpR family regulator